MRTFFFKALVLLFTGLSVAVTAQAAPSLDQQVFMSKLAGTWNEVMRAEPSCVDKKYLHTFTLSADGLVLTKRYLVPVEGPSGLVSEVRYRVLYGDANAMMLFREDEQFESRDTGDKLLRQLILEPGPAYAWRMYGMPKDHRAAAGGLRCGN